MKTKINVKVNKTWIKVVHKNQFRGGRAGAGKNP